MRPYAFGVDIGGTAVKLGLFQTGGKLTEKWSISTRGSDNGSGVLPDVVASLREAPQRLHGHSVHRHRRQAACQPQYAQGVE